MRTNRTHFERSLLYLPAWVCGYCMSATLREETEGHFQREWANSKAARNDNMWGPEWIEIAFAVMLQCPDCHTGTVVSGKVETDCYASPNGNEAQQRFVPQAFTIAPAALIPPSKLPETVENMLQPIFRHIWNDPAACGGAIRRCVETILNDLGVRKITRKDGKQTTLSTHSRIEHHLPVKAAAAKNHLMAIKWVGNFSAHKSTSMHSRPELLDACEQLQHALRLIYGIDQNTRLARQAAKMTARKGRPEPKPKRRRRSV